MTTWFLNVATSPPAPPAILVDDAPTGAVYDALGALVGTSDPNYTGDHTCTAVVGDHVAQGLALLISQYREKPRIRALLSVFLEKVQELEWVAADMDAMRDLEQSVGVWLANIGRSVGQENQGWLDDDYRKAIKARIRVNVSEGSADDMISVYRELYTAFDMPADIYEPIGGKAEFVVNFGSELWGAFLPAFVFSLLLAAKTAGVRLLMLFHLTNDSNLFAFSSVSGVSQVSTTHGLSNVARTTGGHLRGVFGV